MLPDATPQPFALDPEMTWLRDMHQALACPLFGGCSSIVESTGETVCHRFPESPFKEGVRIVCGNVRFSAAAYGLRIRGHDDLPVSFRQWLYEEDAPTQNRAHWCFGEEIASLHERTDIFLVTGDPLSVSSWDEARQAARKAKAVGALTLLLASMPYQATSLAEFQPEFDAEDADCLLHMDDGDGWFSFVAVLRILATCLRSGPSPALDLDDLRTAFPSGSQCRIEYWMGARRHQTVGEWVSSRVNGFMNDSQPSNAAIRSAFLAINGRLEPNESEQARQAASLVLPQQATPLICHRPRSQNPDTRFFEGMFFCTYQPPTIGEEITS